MSKDEITSVVEEVLMKLNNKDFVRKQQSYANMFKEGVFRFIIPGFIVFLATFFALQRSFEIFRIKTETRFVAVEKDVAENKEDIEDQETSFDELAKEYYSNTRGDSSPKNKETN